jgi:hypothetical protein
MEGEGMNVQRLTNEELLEAHERVQFLGVFNGIAFEEWDRESKTNAVLMRLELIVSQCSEQHVRETLADAIVMLRCIRPVFSCSN